MRRFIVPLFALATLVILAGAALAEREGARAARPALDPATASPLQAQVFGDLAGAALEPLPGSGLRGRAGP